MLKTERCGWSPGVVRAQTTTRNLAIGRPQDRGILHALENFGVENTSFIDRALYGNGASNYQRSAALCLHGWFRIHLHKTSGPGLKHDHGPFEALNLAVDFPSGLFSRRFRSAFLLSGSLGWVRRWHRNTVPDGCNRKHWQANPNLFHGHLLHSMQSKNSKLLVTRHVDFAIRHHWHDVGIPARIRLRARRGLEKSVQCVAARWFSLKREQRDVRRAGIVGPRNSPDNGMIVVVRQNAGKESG